MRITLITVAVLATLVAPAAAHAADAPYKTDPQAERYLETHLPAWAGYDLTQLHASASCSNGAYSRHEQRTGRHHPQRIDRNGEARFRTFACSLSFDDGADYRTFEGYVQTRAKRPWRVTADR